MSLVTCPECGNAVSSTAATCPRCGYALTAASAAGTPVRERGVRRKRRVPSLIITLLVLTILVLAALWYFGVLRFV